MSGKIKRGVNFISFVIFGVCLHIGCGNAPQNLIQIKKENRETRSLTIPQYELIETPKYTELKQQVEKARRKANELKIKKNELEAKYTEEYPPVKYASKNYEEAKKNLVQLERLLDEETERLEKRPINPLI